jgi:DNA-binding transcriptional MerR regulator
MELTEDLITELEQGVTQTRMAEIAGISASSLRGLEKDGLVPLHSGSTKKLYGAASLEALERIKTLKASGASLEDVKARVLPAPKTEAQLMVELELARTALTAARAKLAALAGEVTERVIVQRNELRLSKQELEALEVLRQSNLRRAAQVERKAKSLGARMQYALAPKPHVVRVDLPAAPKRKRK